MTNLEWIKQEWIRKIESLTEDELYEILTNGTVRGGICRYCERLFPPCSETLKNDDICRERFRTMCGMEHQRTEDNEYV